MSAAIYRVRRATVDDLEALRALWVSMQFPAAELEPGLTEFQVAVTEDDALLGALAIQISGRHGRLHSEAFTDFGLTDALRPLLWERMQSLAKNHGLARLWTREEAPFWKREGFQGADAETLKKLPAGWAQDPKGWRTIKLRDEEALENTLEKEFARFKMEEKQRVEQALRRAKMMKVAATLLAILLAIFVISVSLYLLMKRPELTGH